MKINGFARSNVLFNYVDLENMMEEQKKIKWRLPLEAVSLFVGIPMLLFVNVIPVPKILVLILVAAYCVYRLWQDPAFTRGLFRKVSESNASKVILMRSLIIIPGLTALVWVLHPDRLFSFPAERPVLWMVVMVLYPLLSALPQEFIYRTFFFHRYGNVMTLKNSTVIASASAFAFMHIIYDNWWAVGLSFFAGLLLGLTYARTKSLFWVTVEHAIYGSLVFTIGMGQYFYEPFWG